MNTKGLNPSILNICTMYMTSGYRLDKTSFFTKPSKNMQNNNTKTIKASWGTFDKQ